MRGGAAWRLLRDTRYALPGALGRVIPAPDAPHAVAIARQQARAGAATTIGYFEGAGGDPSSIMAAYARVAQRARGLDLSLSVKAPPLRFDPVSLRELAQIARQSGLSLVFDAHGPQDAHETLAAVERLLPDFPDTGIVLPARWQRSQADAVRLRDSSAPVRIVRGEWPDPAGDAVDPDAAYLTLVEALAGRAAPVAIATHRPVLADRALALLRDAGTPCSLEQLRGLPGRRCRAVARGQGVPVRLYVPFGPGWIPYALDRALARPYLLAWMWRDWTGRADP